ncbi:HugZ family pyridoxamine 5'-phosphate oxidase [Polyangium jinanense]|uniref:DUF2470 domain-containing protein n=1 Tax=Polyangium jinanense TaxID=2829994 RepID=A0A9X3X9D3_9BACT|nr:DUF2470 domain-containing protein [Polyangium jinanense]MDC3960229.1 DUF2470 domain-containing protein [Polyangium jinanense]MDC3984945.1 DUF2470 domain-containing protein [Polyangium jinanense]
MTKGREQNAAGNESQGKGVDTRSTVAGTGPSGASPHAPSHAERARTLARAARFGSLATMARDPEGFPYASLVALATDARGRALFLLSRLAEHTQNLLARPEASVLLLESPIVGDKLLEKGRVTLIGPCTAVPPEEVSECRALFLAAHPDAATYADFADFSHYRIEPRSLRYVGGFGRMSWVDVAAYTRAEPDPLAEFAPRILGHMNDDHASSILAYARKLAGIAEATSAQMTAVDRYGIEMAVETPSGERRVRLAFDTEIRTREEARKALIEMAGRAGEGED